MVLDPAVIASIQDPITLATLSGLLSGTASGFIEHGLSWVSDRYKGHPKAAIKAAQINVVDFFGRVNICLEGQQQIEDIDDKKQQALTDPDYTSLFQEAVLGAARTDSEQKHTILARLVTDRLAAEPDSLRILAAHMACNAVPQLSPIHLRFLGFMAIIYVMDTPDYVKASSEETGFVPYQETFEKGLNWLSDELSPLLPIGEMTDYDYAHLAAVSCIAYGRGRRDLLDVLIWKFSTKGGSRCWIEQDQIGKVLCQYWDQDLVSDAFLTPAGALLGMHVRDIIPREPTKWTF